MIKSCDTCALVTHPRSYICAKCKDMSNWREQSAADMDEAMRDTIEPQQLASTGISAENLLSDAASIMAERGRQYDQDGGERSMAKTVAMFNIATGRDMSEAEGWLFMDCLKTVRLFHNTARPHEDSVKDKIAYAALLGETALTKGLK